MQLKDIISTLMLSDLYFNLPLWERKREVFRLWALYGAKLPITSELPYAHQSNRRSHAGPWAKR
jgi:hypothetical protein